MPVERRFIQGFEVLFDACLIVSSSRGRGRNKHDGFRYPIPIALCAHHYITRNYRYMD